MKLKAVKNTLVCRKIGNDRLVSKSCFLIRNDELEIYEVLDFSVDDNSRYCFSDGDLITVDGKCDEFDFEGEKYSLVKADHVSSKVVKENKE